MSDLTPCQTSTVDLWFSDDVDEIEAAVNLCHTCPLEALCATLGASEPFGVWGGVPDRHQARKTGGVGRNVAQIGVHEDRHGPKKTDAELAANESKELLQAMWQREWPVWKIAYELGISEDAVDARVSRMRKQGWDMPKRNTGYVTAV